ncbi:MAG: SLBB domain-containing protein [Planctomycetaceae bacterium]|nr:SLBB domain-containing protein [Planctomycetaceae bacterium]
MLSTSGCATNRVVASKLPEEWQAEVTANAQTLELAKIATPSLQSDEIARGDVLEISISAGLNSDNDVTKAVRVEDDGSIELSELGHLHVEGLELVAAEAVIATRCMEKGLYRSPQITVTMKQAKMNTVTVIGAVKEPNTYRLRSGSSSVLAALVRAGGLADNAGTTIEIRHPGFQAQDSTPAIASLTDDPNGSGIVQAGFEESVEPNGARSMKIDLITATKQGYVGNHLPDGTIVMVEPRDPEAIHVIGLVKKPNQYEFPVGKELKLLDAIALAGGIANPVANKVYIIRKKPGTEETILIEATIRKAKNKQGLDNPRLAPGDVVSLEQTPATAFFEALRLVGFGVSGSAF